MEFAIKNNIKENKVKKKLVLTAALFAVGVATNVKAEVYGNQRIWGFRTDWEQGRDFAARPIKKGDSEIKVKTAPEAVLVVELQRGNEETWKKIPQKKNDTLGNSEIQKTFSVANGSGFSVFYLGDEHQPRVGDKYKLTLTIDGFYLAGGEWTVGESIPRDEEEKDEAEIQKFIDELERKEKEADAQKNALELFEQQQQEEANKTWYQRIGDGMQDQWWNFKGWLRG